MTADPLHLEMVLQRRRFGVGMPAMREEVASQLARDGVSLDDLRLFLAYFEDRGKRLDDWRAVAWAELRKVGKCAQVVRDLRASTDQAGKAERGLGMDHAMAGGEQCQHGTPRGHHCEGCDPQPLRGDQLIRMREVMFEDLVRWMMRDIPSLQSREQDEVLESDSPEQAAQKRTRAEQKRQRAQKIEGVLRRYLLAVGGSGEVLPSFDEVSREDQELVRNAVPDHILRRRIAENQRFPGETVQTGKGGRMNPENWRKQANACSRELWKTGPLVGHLEMAAQRRDAEDDATAQPADAADEWRELTEGAF